VNSMALANVWRVRMVRCKESGLTVTEYCRQNNLQKKGYYYWKRRIAQLDEQEELFSSCNAVAARASQVASSRCTVKKPSANWLQVETPVIVAASTLQHSSSSCITLKISGAEIEISQGFNPDLLRSVVTALCAQPC